MAAVAGLMAESSSAALARTAIAAPAWRRMRGVVNLDMGSPRSLPTPSTEGVVRASVLRHATHREPEPGAVSDATASGPDKEKER